MGECRGIPRSFDLLSTSPSANPPDHLINFEIPLMGTLPARAARGRLAPSSFWHAGVHLLRKVMILLYRPCFHQLLLARSRTPLIAPTDEITGKRATNSRRHSPSLPHEAPEQTFAKCEHPPPDTAYRWGGHPDTTSARRFLRHSHVVRRSIGGCTKKKQAVAAKAVYKNIYPDPDHTTQPHRLNTPGEIKVHGLRERAKFKCLESRAQRYFGASPGHLRPIQTARTESTRSLP